MSKSCLHINDKFILQSLKPICVEELKLISRLINEFVNHTDQKLPRGNKPSENLW